MDKERFCDKYCPIPTLYYSLGDADDSFTECDFDEETECPFRSVDFNKVQERI
jgi:hypothetical protein